MKLLTRMRYKRLRHQYRHHASPTTFDWDWESLHYNRIALVNLLVGLRGGMDCRYLEIGCDNNRLFSAVPATNKVGVDPAKGGTHRQTSDNFFAENKDTFDVIFIDGLHEYEQVRQDAVNALSCLRPGGWIAFHDFLPKNWGDQHVPRLQKAWTGDCWKLAVELSKSSDIDFKILEIDHGVGVIRPNVKNATIVDMRDTLRTANFDYFVKALPQLPSCPWEQGVEWIKEASL